MMVWEEPVSEWQSAHEWLKDYNAYEEQEMDRRRFIEYLMTTTYTPEAEDKKP